jgi:hypothetical protein
MGDNRDIARTTRLSNRIIGLSVSESADLAALGMLDGEDKLFLGAVLTPLVYSGARVAYGGRIAHRGTTNFTWEISGQLAEAYRRQDTALGQRPMIHYLRAADAGSVGSDQLFSHALRLGSHSEVRLLLDDAVVATMLPTGRIVDVHAGLGPPVAVASGAELAKIPELAVFFSGNSDSGLAGMRRAVTRDTDARIIMGGAIARTSEGLSGVVAEAISALDAEKPLLIIGGVGGASRDIAARLGLIADAELVVRRDTDYVDKDGKPSKQRYDTQLAEIAARRPRYEQMMTEKGIGDDLRRLAISEGHIEIGSLILEILSACLPPRAADRGEK